MIPPPPRSTLFPYTTLFRSVGHVLENLIERMLHDVLRVADHRLGDHVAHERLQRRLQPMVDVRRRALLLGRDRKSTRLNSSHRCISYAVFCLKKKKKEKKEKKEKKKNNEPYELHSISDDIHTHQTNITPPHHDDTHDKL